MRFVHQLALLTLAMFFLIGCGRAPKVKDIVGRWELRKVELTPEEATSPVFPSGAKPGPRSGAFLNVAEDGSMLYAVRDAAYRGKLTPAAQGRHLLGTREDGLDEFVILSKRGERMIVAVQLEQTVRHYLAQPAPPPAERGDLFGEELNEWRMPAKTPLDSKAIHRRALSLVRYLDVFFNEAYMQDLNRLDYETLHTPFVFAANGMVVHRIESVDEIYRSYLMSDKELEQKIAFLSEATRNIVPIANANRFLMYSRMLDQMCTELEKAKP